MNASGLGLTHSPRYTAGLWGLTLLGGWAALWYYQWLFRTRAAESGNLVSAAFLGFLPIALVLVVSVAIKRARFAPVAVVALAIVFSQKVTFYPQSPDMAFHIAKTIWAERGQWLIDPTLGIITGYPAVFHLLWGTTAGWLSTDAAVVLRWATACNLLGLWFVIWCFGPRFREHGDVTLMLWLAALCLFAKDISGLLLATPSGFSMPLALAAWWMWGTAKRIREVVIGGLLLVAATVIWPGHLFSALGVGLVGVWPNRRKASFWILALFAAVGFLIVWGLRQLAPGGESWTGMDLIPNEPLLYLRTRVVHLVSLGADANGWLVATASTLLTAVYIALFLRGRRAKPASDSVSGLTLLGTGLAIGAILGSWIMIQPNYGSRLLSIALLTVAPIAAHGLSVLERRSRLNWVFSQRLWRAGLGFVWLVPFLAAGVVSAKWQSEWKSESQPVSNVLRRLAEPGDRVWATPRSYRQVGLGKAPVFGFLAHNWPAYYGAPKFFADSVAAEYRAIAAISSSDKIPKALWDRDVDWIVLDRVRDRSLKLSAAIDESLPVVHLDSNYVLYRVKP